jgi:transposase-like protein
MRAMGFGSYHTAFRWLHAMREIMVLPGRNLLNGEVEVDERFIGGVKSGKRGRGAAGKVLVMIAAEVRGSAIGRIRLKVIPDAAGETLGDAVTELVEKGSEVVTDGWSGYIGLSVDRFSHTVSRSNPAVGQNMLPKVNRVASLLKRWIMGTHQGSVSKDMLPAYLNEFVFRFNRRTARRRGLLFQTLLKQAVSPSPP